jgi:beta-lactam-binding protein with PASTA domain
MSNKPNTEGSWMGRSIFLNILLIIIVAALGIWIAYISIALFTKHGQRDIVPNVENMSYTEAIKKLNAAGFKVDIRDSFTATTSSPDTS